MSDKGFSRRAVTVGGGIAAALGLTALGVTVPRLFGHHYRKTPYDDLLAQLVDRDAAAKVGRAALGQDAAQPGMVMPWQLSTRTIVKALRARLERRTLAEVTNAELAEGALVEVRGWVMPSTLVMLSVLAAAAER